MRLVTSERRTAKIPKLRTKSVAGQIVMTILGVQFLFFVSFFSLDLPTASLRNLESAASRQTTLCLNSIPVALDAVPETVNAASVTIEHLPEVVDELATKCATFKSPFNKIADVLNRLPKTIKPLPRMNPVKIAMPKLATPTKVVRYSPYVPQAPAALFLAYVLGYPASTIAAALFVAIGAIGPFFGIVPFASGGGPEYYLQPGFGYLLGMMAATVVVGKLSNGARTSPKQLGAIASGIVVVHLTGIGYLLISSLLFNLMQSPPNWLPWVFDQVRNLSWYALPYDVFFSFMAIGLGFPIKSTVNVLTSPDIALKSHNDVMVQRQLEELLQ